MAVKMQIQALGWKQFQKNVKNINANLINPQSGISNAMVNAIHATIIPAARRNVYKLFDTTGDFPSRIDTEVINQFRVDIVVRAVYGAVHEFGGTFKVTDKQRRFFWAKHYETKEDMWKALALSKTYTIPARPYLRPALDTQTGAALEMLGEEIYITMKKAVK